MFKTRRRPILDINCNQLQLTDLVNCSLLQLTEPNMSVFTSDDKIDVTTEEISPLGRVLLLFWDETGLKSSEIQMKVLLGWERLGHHLLGQSILLLHDAHPRTMHQNVAWTFLLINREFRRGTTQTKTNIYKKKCRNDALPGHCNGGRPRANVSMVRLFHNDSIGKISHRSVGTVR